MLVRAIPTPAIERKTIEATSGELEPWSEKRKPARAGPTTNAVSSKTDSSDSAESSSLGSVRDLLHRVRVIVPKFGKVAPARAANASNPIVAWLIK